MFLKIITKIFFCYVFLTKAPYFSAPCQVLFILLLGSTDMFDTIKKLIWLLENPDKTCNRNTDDQMFFFPS